jgi:hypothetical protein
MIKMHHRVKAIRISQGMESSLAAPGTTEQQVFHNTLGKCRVTPTGARAGKNAV